VCRAKKVVSFRRFVPSSSTTYSSPKFGVTSLLGKTSRPGRVVEPHPIPVATVAAVAKRLRAAQHGIIDLAAACVQGPLATVPGRKCKAHPVVSIIVSNVASLWRSDARKAACRAMGGTCQCANRAFAAPALRLA
jgi:hypothetical protein